MQATNLRLQGKREDLSEASLEDLLISVMNFRTKSGLLVNYPLEEIFTPEFMKLFPESVTNPVQYLRGCNL